MSKVRLFVAAAFATAMATAPAAFAETKWIMASGYPDNNFLTKVDRAFISEVESKSGGELKIELRSNGSLIKLDAIKRAVQSGQVQAGEIRLGVYGNESPMFVLDNIPNVAKDYDEAKKLTEAQKPYFDDLFAKNGMRIVSYLPWPGQGLFTKAALSTPADFKGLKLRIYSKGTQQMGEMLGFQATILPFAEVPQAFSTGLIDSLFTSAQTGIDIQAWDYVKNFMYTGTMHNKNAIILNERAVKALSPKLQGIVMEAAANATALAWKESETANAEQVETLRKNGMAIAQVTPAIANAFESVSQTMIADWRKESSPAEVAVLDTYLKTVGK
jgi:TRAP-type transport system periplasmic protein